MIEFLCPNGHKIHCPEEQAGRAAKCPRCGVKFRIPDPSEAEVADSSAGGSDASPAELTDSGVSRNPPGRRPEASQQEPQIEFLCPEGHRLHGAASLQGRPGECPECGSRFRIPTYDDVPEEEEGEEGEFEIGIGRADGGAASGVALADTAEIAAPPAQDSAGEPSSARYPAGRHPLAGLFCKLWSERPPGAAVELHLTGGETLLPEQFAAALSQQSHAVFAVKEPTGTHMLTVVAWDSIARVQIRGVAELPEEMSD